MSVNKANYKLADNCKLKSKDEIDLVFEQPTIRKGNEYFLILGRQNQLNVARLGLLISKKNLKKAVDRNKVKRISREFFRLHQYDLKGFDLILLTRPQIKKCLNENTNKEKKQIKLNNTLIKTWVQAGSAIHKIAEEKNTKLM